MTDIVEELRRVDPHQVLLGAPPYGMSYLQVTNRRDDMIDDTTTEETTTTRKTYELNGRRMSLKAYVAALEDDRENLMIMLAHENKRCRRALRVLDAYVKAAPLPPPSERTDEWLATFTEAKTLLNGLEE